MVKRVLDILGWIGTALVFGAVVVRIVKPEWDQYAIDGAWAGLACVVLYAAGQWREIGAYFQRRQARYGALASFSVLVVLGILVAVNYLAARENKRWDLTENKQFSLSDQTVKLLKNLDAPVKLVVFDKGADLDRYKPVFQEYEYLSPKVASEYVDADKKPVQAKQYNIDSYGTIVVEYKGRREKATSPQEQDLTNALIKVVTGQKKKVYFVAGHGEKDEAGSGRDGYGTVVTALAGDNYEVAKLVLAQQKDVPADASVLVIAGPKGDFLAPEADMLRRYLNKGGHLLALVDPPEGAGGGMPLLEALLHEWSMAPGNNIVVDVSGIGQILGTDASMPVAATYPPHPITEGFRMLTAFPLARSVEVAPAEAAGQSGRTARPIIQTSEKSWAETDIKELQATGKVAMEPEKGDKPGPVTIGAAVAAPVPDATPAPPDGKKPENDAPKAETRVALIGDSDFAANAYLGIQGNRDLFLNTVNWLAQQENLISIRPKEASDRRITLTSSQQTGIFWFSLLVLPAAVLGTGVYTWSRRR